MQAETNTSHASGRRHRSSTSAIGAPRTLAIGGVKYSVARMRRSHSAGHDGSKAKLTMSSTVPPSAVATHVARFVDAAIIGSDACGLAIDKKAMAGKKAAAVRIIDHWPSRADVRNGRDGKIGSRYQLCLVAPNASSADDKKMNAAPARSGGRSVSGIAATSAGAG